MENERKDEMKIREDVNVMHQPELTLCREKVQLTKLDNRVHGTNTSQDTRELILPYVCQPLCDGILDHFVYTEEATKCGRSKTKKLTRKLFYRPEKCISSN